MAGYAHFLHCLGRATLKQAGKALLGLAPLGERLYDLPWTPWRCTARSAASRTYATRSRR